MNQLIHESLRIQKYLHTFKDSKINPLDTRFLPVPPFKRTNDIKLIITGQDRTIRNASQRAGINCTLNLDKPGALKAYVQNIFQLLEIEF